MYHNPHTIVPWWIGLYTRAISVYTPTICWYKVSCIIIEVMKNELSLGELVYTSEQHMHPPTLCWYNVSCIINEILNDELSLGGLVYKSE